MPPRAGYFDRGIPGRPDFYTGRASNDELATTREKLQEQIAELSRMNDALRDKNTELEDNNNLLREQLDCIRRGNGGVADQDIVLKKTGSTALDPNSYRSGKVPLVIAAIAEHPGLIASQLAEILGVTIPAVTFQVKRYADLIHRQRERHIIRHFLREGV